MFSWKTAGSYSLIRVQDSHLMLFSLVIWRVKLDKEVAGAESLENDSRPSRLTVGR